MNFGKHATINSFDMEKIRISSSSRLEASLGTWHEYGTEQRMPTQPQIKPPDIGLTIQYAPYEQNHVYMGNPT